MISVDDYFGPRRNHPEATDLMRQAAVDLLLKVNQLLEWAGTYGFDAPIDPDTGTQVSGSYNKNLPEKHSGDGGFRASDSLTGGLKSLHRRARAVDVYDPENKLDDLLTDDILEHFGLYREAPSKTLGWCHLQDLPPGSGRRTYEPY